MVKTMMEAEETWGSGQGNGLSILCFRYNNHALDSFTDSLMDGGVPAEEFIRLGSSPKITERLGPCCLREQSQSTFNIEERRGYAILMSAQEALGLDLQHV